MKMRSPLLLMAVWLLTANPPVLAHHSFAARFDMDKWITLTGKVTVVRLINPHPTLEMEVTGADGTKTTWLITSQTGLIALRNAGWTNNTLPLGTVIKLDAHPALLAGAKTVIAGTVTLPDGKQLSLGGTLGVAAN
jgi:hypothetical protein